MTDHTYSALIAALLAIVCSRAYIYYDLRSLSDSQQNSLNNVLDSGRNRSVERALFRATLKLSMCEGCLSDLIALKTENVSKLNLVFGSRIQDIDVALYRWVASIPDNQRIAFFSKIRFQHQRIDSLCPRFVMSEFDEGGQAGHLMTEYSAGLLFATLFNMTWVHHDWHVPSNGKLMVLKGNFKGKKIQVRDAEYYKRWNQLMGFGSNEISFADLPGNLTRIRLPKKLFIPAPRYWHRLSFTFGIPEKEKMWFFDRGTKAFLGF